MRSYIAERLIINQFQQGLLLRDSVTKAASVLLREKKGADHSLLYSVITILIISKNISSVVTYLTSIVSRTESAASSSHKQ